MQNRPRTERTRAVAEKSDTNTEQPISSRAKPAYFETAWRNVSACIAPALRPREPARDYGLKAGMN